MSPVVELALSVLPLVLGLLVCVGFRYLDESRHAVRGVAGPYFAAVALLFGMFASLIAGEVWQRASRDNAVVMEEANALRSLLRLSEVAQPAAADQVRRAVAAYVDDVEREELTDAGPPAAEGASVDALRELYQLAADGSLFGGAAPTTSAFLGSLEKVRSARFERLELRQVHVSRTKLALLFLFGFLTQVSIALPHAGNPRAIAWTVMLFSLAFSGAVAVLTVFDQPYRGAHLVSAAALRDVR